MKMRTFGAIVLALIATIGISACGGKAKSGSSAQASAAASAAAMPGAAGGSMATGAEGGTIPNCGAVQAVWVNLKTKVYHAPSDALYGKTKHGEYLCPAQAKAQGFRPAGGVGPERRHSKGASAPT